MIIQCMYPPNYILKTTHYSFKYLSLTRRPILCEVNFFIL